MKILTLFLMTGLGLTAAAVVPPAVATPVSIQDEDPPAGSDPISDLEQRVEALEKANGELTARLQAQEELLAKAYAWMKSLPGAGAALRAKVEEARRDGFEKAGPNPRSKKAVLDGLAAFAGAMSAANPAASPKSPENPRRR